MKPTLHLLGLPHTITTGAYSHCAFTGKVLRFSPMLRSVGYNVIHYGNEGAVSGANEQVDILSFNELNNYITKYDPTGPTFIGEVANLGTPLYEEYNKRLNIELKKRVSPKDIICLPFGIGHQAALAGVSGTYLETGIGYMQAFAEFRIYESNCWYNWQSGKENRNGKDYHWVIPNYFDISEWTFQPNKGQYLLYFGRICNAKGVEIVVEIARNRPDLKVILCGQGDATPYLKFPNIEYLPPKHGKERDTLLGNALAVLMPTRYVEPFGGVTVEANLTGTPVLGSSYGSFTETIIQGINGYRCNTLGDWLAGIELVEEWGPQQRQQISDVARSKYDMYKLAHKYDDAIQQITDLQDKGWYTLRSSLGPIKKVA
jgi:glycosyltransferase involved in cell wall biosynthesis